MQREFLKSLELTDETIDKIMAEYGKSINSAKTETEKLRKANEELTNRLDAFKDYEDLKTKASKGTEATEKLTKEIKNLKLANAIERELWKSKAKNIDVVRKTLSLEDVDFDEAGKLTGLDEQITKLKASDSYLFASDKDPIPSPGDVGMTGKAGKPVNDPVKAEFLKRNPGLTENDLN